MSTAFNVILPTHIVAGAIALLTGLIAMLTHKGGRTHRRAGKLFFWSMAYIGLSAAALALLGNTGIFLLLVGVFSFYLAFTGYRALYHKKPADRHGTWLDWSVGIIALTGSLFLILVPMVHIAFFPHRYALVAQIFGGLGTFFAAWDLYNFLRPSDRPMRWWFIHMQRMLASYAAAATAFSVVNFEFLPLNIRWLWPTGAAFIGGTIWAQYYRRKFAAGRPSHEQSKEDITQTVTE